MPDLTMPIAAAGSTTLTLAEFLSALHRRQLLRPLLLEATVEKRLVEMARQAGLEISTEHLQQAVNRFRQQRGLRAVNQTDHWLAAQGLTLPDLETTLESDLLIVRLEERLTATPATDYFAANPDDFTRIRLRVLVVASEGEARELLSQLSDDGWAFADLARQHSLHLPSRAAGGSLAPLCRCELPPDVARAVASAAPGAVIGPLPGEKGFSLFLVEELLPADLNPPTMSLIRRHLFDAWLHERLAEVRLDLSWLDQVDVPS
jgi:parvulin-like peptidyl-prolyl isomerase